MQTLRTTLHLHYDYYYFYKIVCVRHVLRHVCAMHAGQRTSLWELVLAFHHMGPGDQTQVARLGSSHFYPLSLLASSP